MEFDFAVCVLHLAVQVQGFYKVVKKLLTLLGGSPGHGTLWGHLVNAGKLIDYLFKLMKSAKGYCIVSLRSTESRSHGSKADCIEAFIRWKKSVDYVTLTWKDLQKKGYKRVKARVSV